MSRGSGAAVAVGGCGGPRGCQVRYSGDRPAGATVWVHGPTALPRSAALGFPAAGMAMAGV